MKFTSDAVPNRYINESGDVVYLQKKDADRLIKTYICNGTDITERTEEDFGKISTRLIPNKIKHLIDAADQWSIKLEGSNIKIFQFFEEIPSMLKVFDSGIIARVKICDLEEDDTVVAFVDNEIAYKDVEDIRLLQAGPHIAGSINSQDIENFKNILSSADVNINITGEELNQLNKRSNAKEDLRDYIISVQKEYNEGFVFNDFLLF